MTRTRANRLSHSGISHAGRERAEDQHTATGRVDVTGHAHADNVPFQGNQEGSRRDRVNNDPQAVPTSAHTALVEGFGPRRTHIGVGAQLLARSRTAHGAFRERDIDDRFLCWRARQTPQPPRCGALTDTRNDQCVNGRWFTQRMRWREFHMLYRLPPSTLPLNLEPRTRSTHRKPRSLRAQRARARTSK